MPNTIIIKLAVALVASILVALGGFWLGARVTAGGYEKRISDISVAITESQNAAIERHNQALAAERKRFAAAQETRDRQRTLAEGVIDEIRKNTDLSCEHRPAHRMRLDDLYRAYGYDPTGAPLGVQGAVLAPSKPGVTP